MDLFEMMQRSRQAPSIFGNDQGGQPLANQGLASEDQAGLLSGLISGIQYAGESLEKPGVALTGLLSGDPSALLNLIPFSDTLGITDPRDRIYARDMFAKWGIAPPNQPGFGSAEDAAWDVGGFATDVLLNPLNLIGLMGPTAKGLAALKAGGPTVEALRGVAGAAEAAPGALGAAVEAAKASGELGAAARIAAKTPLAQIREFGTGERALLNLYSPAAVWPFNKILGTTAEGMAPIASYGTGAGVANTLEKLAFNQFTSLPIKLFAHTAGNVADTTIQKTNMLAQEELHQNLGHVYDVASVWGGAMRHLETEFGKIAKWNKETGDPQAFESMMDLLLEPPLAQKLSPAYMEDIMKRMTVEAQHARMPATVAAETLIPQVAADTAKRISELAHEYYGVFDAMGDAMNTGYKRVQSMGLKARDMEDLFIPHSARRTAGGAMMNKDLPDTARLLSTYFGWASRRNIALRDYPEGTYLVNQISREPLITATKNGMNKAQLRSIFEAKGIDKTTIQTWLAKEGIGEATLRSEIMGQLGELGAKPVADMPTLDLQVELARKKFFEPAMIRSGIDPTDERWTKTLFGDLLETVDPKTGAAITPRLPPNTFNELSKTFGQEANSFKPVAGRAASKAEQAVRYFRRASPEMLEKGLFNRDTVTDWTDYMEKLAAVESNMKTMHNFLGGVAKIDDAAPVVARLTEGTSPTASNTAKVAGRWLQSPGGRAAEASTITPEMIAKETVIPLKTAWQATGLDELGLLTFAKNWATKNNVAFTDLDELTRRIVVPPEAVRTIAAYADVMKPKTQGEISKAFNTLQSLWKGWVTSTPSFHARDFVSGQFMALMNGDFNPANVVSAGKYLVGKGELPFLDEIKTLPLLRQGNRIVDTFGEAATAGMSNEIKTIPQVLKEPFSALVDAMRGGRYGEVGTMLNPFAMRGAFTGKGENIISKIGGDLYSIVEFMNRVPQYITLRQAGMTPGQALHQVKLSQFDYTELTKFEKDYMRKLLPFATWSRKNIPYQLNELITNPGGRTATTLKAMHALQGGEGQGDEYTPSWLRETSMVRVPGGTPEATTFIRGLGLPVEDLRNFVFTNALGLKSVPGERTLERFGSMLTPGIKIPVEWFSDKSMYTGRPQKYMKPITGNQMLDTLLFRSGPLGPITSRVEGFASESTPTAIAEALTGAKVGTYDLSKWRLIEQKQRLADLLDKNPDVRTFQDFYVPKDQKAAADPKTMEQLALMKQLNAAITRLMEQQKAAKEQ